ncbi:hypothetical protein C485_17312 [Natrinema altunense JCM 12890]|uniref:Uncharacterized protein n=1 Tax=Natrinema altunense (strain JCM 12890 / CGMCC 1.3731 / AJ2) TaxID=1227494 RepID=L9ZEF8_NATA2|nr:hypothetical protein C485_17312 [Natrinema altunense JCM 12890]
MFGLLTYIAHRSGPDRSAGPRATDTDAIGVSPHASPDNGMTAPSDASRWPIGASSGSTLEMSPSRDGYFEQ